MKIAVLVSGGVDSAVALALLKQQGHEVTAYYLKIWLEDELSHLADCPWEQDLLYVRQVCMQLDVPLEVVSMQEAYQEKVVAWTIDQVRQGLTPNPDMLCNQRIKFGMFYTAVGHKYDKIATGHYARIFEKDGMFELHQAPDAIKDQTYFLSQLSQEQLSKASFPIGHLEKTEVRKLAHQFDLANKDRKDSQGICFLGKFKFEDFVRHHLGELPGDLVEVETGRVIGKHNGFWFHTIGQRKGLGLSGGPWFVVRKDTAQNIVYISRNYYTDEKKRDVFEVTQCNWFSGQAPDAPSLKVKLRHGPEKYTAHVSFEPGGSGQVRLDKDDQGIANGQYAVFYDEDTCLGGGVMRCSN